MTKIGQKYKPIDPTIKSLAESHGGNPEAVLEIFQELDSKQGVLTQETIHDVARALQIPGERAYGVASFYSMLTVSDRETPSPPKDIIRVCDGPVCWLLGSTNTRHKAEAEFPEAWVVERTSCLGLCDRAPAALVNEQQCGPLPPERLAEARSGWRGQTSDYSQLRLGELRVMLSLAGKVDPYSIESALENKVYAGFEAALSRSPESIISEIEASGLSGRGGAGFPTGRKWLYVSQARRTPKYVICNADESEPLVFKDRVLIETNPHQILEGMAIAGYATGAREAFIYIRGEYETQASLLEHAIRQADEKGWLGDSIQGTDFSFHIRVHRGAGAYICGEETALIESLEGKRGEPRVRPPYPPTAGYRGLPTLVNNVETYASVPSIILNGADWYCSLSSYNTPGTKIYMLLGHVNHPGLFEAPFGLTLRQLIEEFGGGMRPGSTFQFALTGGAAGTIVPPSLLDVPIDYASSSKGVSLGAGAFLLCDQSVSPAAFLREILHFFTVESCGKCTPCRIGTYQSYQILNRMTESQGLEGDVEYLLSLAEMMQAASFCGLGQSVAIPVKSALTHFPGAFAEAEK